MLSKIPKSRNTSVNNSVADLFTKLHLKVVLQTEHANDLNGAVPQLSRL